MSNFANMLNGAVKGYQIVDEEMREGVRDNQRAGAIQDNKEYRSDQKAHQDRTFEAVQSNNEFNQSRATAQDKRAVAQDGRAIAQEGRAAESHNLSVAEVTRQKLLERDKVAGFRLLQNGTPYPKELHEEMKKANMGDLSIYSVIDNKEAHQNALASGKILQQLKNGNIHAVNTPESLSVINGVYKEQIKKGIGEFNSALGGTVVDKEIIGLETGPKKGSFVAEIEVTLDNGKKFTAPLTMNRSSDPNDNVRLIDGKVAMDDMFVRYQRARIADLNRDQIQKSYDMMYGGESKEPGSTTGKTIKDLMNYGVDKETAIKLATGGDVEKAVRAAAIAIIKNQDEYSDDKMSMKEAMAAAREAFSSEDDPVEKPRAPEEAIKLLMSRPELAPQFKEKYGYLPEGLNSAEQ